MNPSHRREFLEDVGRGMLLAGVGAPLALELGLASTAQAEQESKTLTFGELEPLVALLQETPKEKLLPVLAEKHKGGTDLRTLTSAAAFANARTFGGEDYFGFHTFMALAPAFQMAQEMPKNEQPLPIWKVLYRNAHYTQSHGGRAKDVLHKIDAPKAPMTGEKVREAVNTGNGGEAEKRLAALGTPEDALNAAILGVEDNHDVHSAVMPWRAWVMLDFVGKDHAITMLRQSVRQTAKRCADTGHKPEQLAQTRKLLPKLLDQHKLLEGPKGKREGDNLWLAGLCETVLTSKPDQSGGAVAAALAEGFSPEHVGEAISLAANQLLLRQVENMGGNMGFRTHGDSAGVHMSDETNAWRNMARVANPRNRAAGLILAAVDIARHWEYSTNRKPNPGHQKDPYPWKEHLLDIKGTTADDLLKELDGAVRENRQVRACAIVHNYGMAGYDAKAVFALLRQFAISEDGRLHNEKYYRTVVEEFATTRPSFRWRQLMGLARVAASSYGYSQQDKKEGHAPGYEESRKLLGI
jgi:hypothetical protein